MNFYLLEYAIGSLLRQKMRTSFIGVVLTALIFLISSMVFVTTSIKAELTATADSLPTIIVQNIKGGKPYDIPVSKVEEFLEISGVESASARVWGYYYFRNAGVNFTVIGVEEFESPYKKSLEKIVESGEIFKEENSMIVGVGVKRVLEENYYKEYFNFITPQGGFKEMKIAGVFDSAIELGSNDVIALSMESARAIFDMPKDMATDIVIEVPNPIEIDTVVKKIETIMPNARILTKEDIKIGYQNMFDYKSGVFLALFIISLFTFFMIIFDKTSGVTSQEKKEIGILKAVGWSTEDIIKEKFYEGAVISFFAFLSGIFLSALYVYIFKAPLMSEIFAGYSVLKTTFTLPFVVDLKAIALIFFITVPIYIGATVVPSWRLATLDSDEIIR